jgi:homogentisate 1,2-dioxygenase
MSAIADLPVTETIHMNTLASSGFRNHVVTEAVPGALPVGQNSPQKVAYGGCRAGSRTYAVQRSGTMLNR